MIWGCFRWSAMLWDNKIWSGRLNALTDQVIPQRVGYSRATVLRFLELKFRMWFKEHALEKTVWF